jgi:DNA polymerase
MAVPLAYCGAHTHRFSGDGGLNCQNLPRSGELRESLTAPEGCAVIAGDLSQIEVRVLAALAGQDDLLEAFRQNQDIYCEFGSKLYGRTITKDDPHERFIAKAAVLGSGYGLGAAKFRDFAKALGGVDVSEFEAQRTIRAYRNTYSKISGLWKTLDRAIEVMAAGGNMFVGPVRFEKEKAILPNDMTIHYPDLRIDPETGNYTFLRKNGRANLWGGVLCENLVQALARIILTDAELRLARRGVHAALSVHDELVYVCKQEHITTIEKALRASLTAPVKWMPTLPLDCEISWGHNYKECK